MLEELRWKTSLSATCLHAAACRAAGIPAANAELAQLLDPAADALAAEIEATQWPVAPLMKQLAAFASDVDNNRELVRRAVGRLHLPPRDDAALVRVAGAIADLEAALLRAQPNLAEELAVRGRPIREQWEARGPGLLFAVGQLADEAIVPLAAEIVLVAPYAGGHGLAHVLQNRITLEAVLHHAHSELPEEVRLAWLLCQLSGNLPRFAEMLPAERAELIFAAAAVPPMLAAAEEVELMSCNERAVDLALNVWGLSGDLPDDGAQKLWQWWNIWLEQPASWPVALAALDAMLA